MKCIITIWVVALFAFACFLFFFFFSTFFLFFIQRQQQLYHLSYSTRYRTQTLVTSLVLTTNFFLLLDLETCINAKLFVNLELGYFSELR